ncbi:membrane protein [Sporomusaceae bacterium FL31]|nr:membrane protein [Sporomusaceae bacterium FL31]GCE34695.1 membrane protein [Sporomusaceae bacterium]
MKGTLVNAAAILSGSVVGLFLKRGMPERYQHTIMQGLALAVGVIGLQMAFKTQNMLIVILSIVMGAIIGEALNIDALLTKLGNWLTAKLGSQYGNVGEGFVTASLVYCVGAMAVVGSIQDGLTGDASTLYAKSMLDGVSAVVFASTLGIGVALSSVSVIAYQGTITLLAGAFSTLLTEQIITELTAVGGVLIIGISILMLDVKKIKVANLLPAIPAAVVITALWSM